MKVQATGRVHVSESSFSLPSEISAAFVHFVILIILAYFHVSVAFKPLTVSIQRAKYM